MTVFIASLFLPHTIHFDVSKTRSILRPSQPPRLPSQTRLGDFSQGRAASLFAQALSEATPGEKAGIEATEFFLANQNIDVAKLAALSIAPNEPHSPAWGRTSYFTQPKLNIEEPPPTSILRHDAALEREVRGRAGPLPEPREQSHDRALKYADWSVQPAEQGNGGLRNAINAASRAGTLKDKTWVGALGMPTDALPADRKRDIGAKLEYEYDCLTVFTSDSDFDGHYSHFCKTILWPVFHYQIPDNPKSKAYEDHSWVYYVKINQAFADKIVENWKRGDVVWIHDYHLLLVPAMVRKRLPDAQIGFYLHVAFPSSEVFRCLATRKELLEGMLGANLIGFQTLEYCLHFLQTCNRLLCAEVTAEGVQLEERFVDVATFPIGIDPATLSKRRDEDDVKDWLHRIKSRYSDKILIVARDKLDHVRGVRQKLLAYELFLNKYPEFREQCVLIQVATSTTEPSEIDSTVSDIVTRINSAHSTLSHQPLVYLKQDIEYPQFLAMITSADALMITSLREGMNLTSHEFIFCQDGKYGGKKHGSLILSEFTGSSTVLDGTFLSINPWDYSQCAEAIRKAITMGSEEKTQRWSKLMGSVLHHNAEKWHSSFMAHLKKAWTEHTRRDTVSIPRLSVHDLREQYRGAQRRLFMLDYEGTLASHESPNSKSMLFTSPQRTLDTLSELLFDRNNVVYVMSAKKPEELDRLFHRVPGLGLIAENGCFYKEAGSEEWIDVANRKEMTWKEGVAGVLRYYSERIEGSWIEERHCSLILHYDKVRDVQSAARQVGECTNQLNDACRGQNVHAVVVDHALTVETMDWSKGTTAERIFKKLGSVDFLMVAGNAREDEPMYRWANNLAKEKVVRDVTTVSVSSRNTEAMATLTQGVAGVLSALNKLVAAVP